jgi:hypothetical protein
VYFWDMEESKVHVVDPMYEVYEAAPIEELHKKNVAEIQKCLCKIVALRWMVCKMARVQT